MRTLEGAIKANELQKQRMIDKLKFLLGGNFKGKHIAILGLTFKPETDDIRESPAISMTEAILKGGGEGVKGNQPFQNRRPYRAKNGHPQVERRF